MTRRVVTEEEFLKQVSTHQVEIVRDDGLYRHIKCKRPGTYCMSFDIVTFPGHLVYTGDMGTYVFSRIRDMFEFFRDKGEGELQVNPHYWSEKALAIDRTDGIKEFDSERVREYIAERVQEFEQERRETMSADGGDLEADEEEELSEIMAHLRHEISQDINVDDGEYAAYSSLRDFTFEGRALFEGSWEISFREYTFRYLWCCYALVWAIRKYDEQRAQPRQSEDAAGAFALTQGT